MHSCPSFPSSLPLTSVPTLISLSCVQLNLSYNFLDPEGAKALAPALAANASLTSLDVRFNSISGDGASQLSTAVLGIVTFLLVNSIGIWSACAGIVLDLMIVLHGTALMSSMSV